jgi:hypothetical protein
MNYKVVDNFLKEEDFTNLQNLIIGDGNNLDFDWKIITDVALANWDKNYDKEVNSQLWNWYAVHPVYNTLPLSPHFDYIVNFFRGKWDLKSLIRIKVNFYPHTSEVKEHAQHYDYDFSHRGALFSLNTCDGFTRMSNGDKVDSVANRMIFFDASELHNSSTTSNQKGRYNINFNYF